MAGGFLNLTTSWLSAAGLGIEMVGFAILSYDLWRSKDKDSLADAMRVAMDDIQKDYREVTYKAIEIMDRNMKGVSQYILMKLEPTPQDGLQKIAETAGEALLKEMGTAEFKSILDRAQAAEIAHKARLNDALLLHVKDNKRFKAAVAIGIAAGACGAALQFLDAIWL